MYIQEKRAGKSVQIFKQIWASVKYTSLSSLKIRSIATVLPITVQLCAFYSSASVELAQAASACAATDWKKSDLFNLNW